MSKVGYVGLGVMGRPMCEHMVAAGIDLTVSDLNQSIVDELVKQGAKSGTYEDIAKNCDIIMMILPNASISYGVIKEMMPNLTAGKLVVDMSSVTPVDSKACADMLSEIGVGFVDAPVSGGEVGAKAATLAIMCGGSQENFDKLVPIFDIIGGSALLIGDVGAGSICKLCNQIIVNMNIATVGEALTFAQKAGADPMKVFKAIRGGLAGSTVLNNKAPLMCSRRFDLGGGTILVNRKDIKNVLATAHAIDCPVPLSAQLFEIQQALAVSGHLADDHSGYVQYFEQLAGVTVHSDEEA